MLELEAEKKQAALKEMGRRLAALVADTSAFEITPELLWKLRLEVCQEYDLALVPKNSELLLALPPELRGSFVEKLRRKSIRTRSGISVITVITKPFDCPHGTCTFCPGGVRFGTPQSYTQNSPAASFGSARGFDPAKQVEDMLHVLDRNGHDTSKIELILLGGTILAMPLEYQRDFVKQSFDALNERASASLEEALRINERARHRCVGLTIETKPDWCRETHLDTLLSYGATRVELGVQSLREEVLHYTNRGHTLSDTIQAFQLAKDTCFKLVAHMMPGLPKSNSDKDLQDLLDLVQDEKYRPDMLKIYPTLLVEGTALFQQYTHGKYTPYSQEELLELLCKFKTQVPPWLRIMRIQREIPQEEISAGVRAGNLRQLVLDRMKARGLSCRCIRCREIGHRTPLDPGASVELCRIDYPASAGEEIFLSFENKERDVLLGFLRLRIPSGREYRGEIQGESAALVRELHVYGTVVPLGTHPANKDTGRPQHQGWGTRLLLEAERIARVEFARRKLLIISAVGTKEYYRKRGYRDDGPYVAKALP